MRTSHTLAIGAGIVAVALVLTGCSAGASTPKSTATSGAAPKTLTKVSFQLNNPPNGSNSGFAVAVEEGYYKKLGLDVTIVPGTGSSLTAQLVSSGQATIGYADSTATTQLIAQKAPMTILSTIYQSNPNEVIALSGSGIKSIADLKDKTVGTPVPSSQASMLPLFLKANKLSADSVNLVNLPPTSLVQSLLSKKVDAILGSLDTYEPQALAQGAKNLYTATFAAHGVSTVSTSIFASNDYITKNPDVVRAFIKGSLQGWKVASTNQSKAIADLNKLWGSTTDPQSAAELKAIMGGGLLCAGGAKYVGQATPTSWETTQSLLSQAGLLPKGIDPTTYYSNKYLPADSELQPCPISTK
jgi:NitT/TauT family transport system substrate-binding protein